MDRVRDGRRRASGKNGLLRWRDVCSIVYMPIYWEKCTMQKRVVGSAIGALALASACATSTGSGTGLRLDESPTPKPLTAAAARVALDSMYAQSIADREGPRVDIRAQITQFT